MVESERSACQLSKRPGMVGRLAAAFVDLFQARPAGALELLWAL